MSKEQVIAECYEELAQNIDCSEDQVEEILTKHGAKLGLIDGVDTVALQMFRLVAENSRTER